VKDSYRTSRQQTEQNELHCSNHQEHVQKDARSCGEASIRRTYADISKDNHLLPSKALHRTQGNLNSNCNTMDSYSLVWKMIAHRHLIVVNRGNKRIFPSNTQHHRDSISKCIFSKIRTLETKSSVKKNTSFFRGY